MSLSLADLVGDRRTLTVTYNDHDVSFVYRPGAYTAEMAANLTTIPIAEVIPQLVVEWDVLDETGGKLAPDAAMVAGMPMRFLRAVMTAILADVSLGEAEGS